MNTVNHSDQARQLAAELLAAAHTLLDDDANRETDGVK